MGAGCRSGHAELAGTLRERADERSKPNLVTQRIISIPADRLMQGDARYNIVVRPGDILRDALAGQRHDLPERSGRPGRRSSTTRS